MTASTKQDSPPVGSASDGDSAETLPVELATGSGLDARQGGGDSDPRSHIVPRDVHSGWRPIATMPTDTPVLTRIDDERGERNVTTLVRKGRLYFFPDQAMYVYYQPTHWRPL